MRVAAVRAATTGAASSPRQTTSCSAHAPLVRPHHLLLSARACASFQYTPSWLATRTLDPSPARRSPRLSLQSGASSCFRPCKPLRLLRRPSRGKAAACGCAPASLSPRLGVHRRWGDWWWLSRASPRPRAKRRATRRVPAPLRVAPRPLTRFASGALLTPTWRLGRASRGI